MVALVSVETVLLVLLVVLVAGLLRSHAEILRRLGPAEDPGEPRLPEAPNPVAAPERSPGGAAPAIAGAEPGGGALALDLAAGGQPTLLAFLSSGCSACTGLWPLLGELSPPGGARTVIVAHGPERERPSAVRRLAPEGVPVVMSSQAWADYRIPGSPYFVLVDARGRVAGEGTAASPATLASLISGALEDGARDEVERRLAAAGIAAGHPSLHPSGRPPG